MPSTIFRKGLNLKHDVADALARDYHSARVETVKNADFCWRAAQAGFAIVCVPAARMWHKVSRSTRGDISHQRYLQHRHRVQFYRHRCSSLAWLYLIPSTLGAMLKDLARGNGRAAWACARGFYHGWRSSVAHEPV